MDIKEFKNKAKDQLSNSLRWGIKLLFRNIRNDSSWYDNLVQYRGRHSQIVSDFHTNIISQADRNLSLDKLRMSILDLINNLESSDLNLINIENESANGNDNKIGDIFGDLPIEVAHIFATTGLTYAYPERMSAMNDIIEDISHAKKSIKMYARVYISELLKGTQLSPAIVKAATSKMDNNNSILIRHVSCDPSDKKLATKQYNIEDPDKKKWKSLEDYQSHLEWSNEVFEDRYRDVLKILDNKSYKGIDKKKSISFESGYLREALLPFSLVVIDDKIVYVSFYALSPNRFGTFAPTMRLVAEDNEETTWADRFLEEGEKINKNYSIKVKRLPLL